MALTLNQALTNIANIFAAHESAYQKLKTSVVGHVEQFQNAGTGGERFSASLNQVEATADQFDGALSLDSLRETLEPQWQEVGQFLGLPNGTDTNAIILQLKQHFIDNSLTVKERNITWGTPAADANNVGTFEIFTIDVDREGNPLEEMYVEAQEYRVVQDQTDNPNNKNQEIGFFYGQPINNNFDVSDMTTSGLSQRVRIISETGGLSIVNGSFSDSFGAPGTSPSTTFIPGYTTTTTNFTWLSKNTSDFYRANNGVASPGSLQADAGTTNVSILQGLTRLNYNFNPEKAYVLFARVKNLSATSFSFDLKLGSQNTGVTNPVPAGWSTISTPLNEKAYPKNWEENNATFGIENLDVVGGSLLIDELVLYEMVKVGGRPYAVLGGQTPASKFTNAAAGGLGDLFTWTNTIAASPGPVNQRYIGLLYDISFPETAGVPTWPDATVL